MKNIKFVIFVILTLFSSLVLAHSGHGDHSAIIASGQPHPFIGTEHVLALILTVSVVLIAMKLLRK